MSECLMAQRGGKYTIGRTIYDYNLSATQYGGTNVWQHSFYNIPSNSIAVDNIGNVYVGDELGYLYKLSSTDCTEIWSNEYSYDYYHMIIHGVAVNNTGGVYVIYMPRTDVEFYKGSAKTVRKLSSINGTEIWSKLFYDIASPYSIAVDNSGNVYVGNNNGIYKLSSIDGTEIWSNKDILGANSIAVDNVGNVYAGNGHLYKLSGTDGTEIWSNNGNGQVRGVAVDNAGNVYVVDYKDPGKIIYKLSNTGTEIWSKNDISEYYSNTFYGIAVDNAGGVYVTYNNNSSKIIRKLSSINGAEIWSKNDIDIPDSVAVDNAGGVYVGGTSGMVYKKFSTSIYTIIS